MFTIDECLDLVCSQSANAARVRNANLFHRHFCTLGAYAGQALQQVTHTDTSEGIVCLGTRDGLLERHFTASEFLFEDAARTAYGRGLLERLCPLLLGKFWCSHDPSFFAPGLWPERVLGCAAGCLDGAAQLLFDGPRLEEPSRLTDEYQ